MSEREHILNRLRRATDAIPEKTPLPDYDPEVAVARPRLSAGPITKSFATNLESVNGRCLHSITALAAFLKKGNLSRGYCDPSLWHTVGEPLSDQGLHVSTDYDRERYDDYEFGITLTSGGIAESGTLILDDYRTTDRLAALTPWVHIAVLHPCEIVATIPEAIERFGNCPNIIWVTGPSKTADIEGILIQGVHGPGEQVCLLMETG